MTATSSEERAALIALLRARPQGVSWAEITAEVLETGSATQVWERLEPAALIAPPGLPHPVQAAAKEIARWTSEGTEFLTVLDADYPERLRGVHQAPPVLFYRGSLRPNDVGVSVVGSRAASRQGIKIATNVARELVARGVTVVSGLALGIDTAAHRSALDAGGRTVGVIATGINKVYPAANRTLHQEIAEKGLLLSQFWPDAPPQKHTYLMRNATMSGYGIATVVVEAGETSGARTQARLAVEHGRPVILTDLVVNGNQWAQALVGRPGVHVASGISEVMAIVDELVRIYRDAGGTLHKLVMA
ncbi:DNA-processing protein DprA [Acrocarpospora phusangensis]|nr:DNA-processing protein DprA [Acrocarpospora phusangensis]